MKVLSLFDGMSCCRIALQKLGKHVDAYYASEIDKHAIQVTQDNYPDTIQLGDVTKWKEWNIPWEEIDLLTAGSPCQGFSFAGKQLAFNDPRSALFFVFVDIWNHLKEKNPQARYLLENVHMKIEHEAVISRLLDINPLDINSALVSAQNRQRLYWTNIYNRPVGLFGHLECMIPQPKDRGILLRDILEDKVDEKYYLSDKMLEYFQNRAANFNNGKINIRNPDDKATTITSSSSSVDISDNFIATGVVNDRGNLREIDQLLCIDANYHKGMDRHAGRTMILTKTGLREVRSEEAKKITREVKQKGKDFTPFREKLLVEREDGKTGCLATGITNDNLIAESDLQTYRIRKLTPTECERLQTVPDGYTKKASDTQRYRMLGNGWNVDTIVHILSYMDKDQDAKL